MPTTHPPSGADAPDHLLARDAVCGSWVSLSPGGPGCRIVERRPNGAVVVQTRSGQRIVLEASKEMFPAAPPEAVAAPPVDLPPGLAGTPKPSPGGHEDRAVLAATIGGMTEDQLRELVKADSRAFVAAMVNNELASREARKSMPRPDDPPPAPPPTHSSPRKSSRATPQAGPTPPPSPEAPSAPPDDRAARLRAALAVLHKHAGPLAECAAAYQELEALGLRVPRIL